VLIDLWGNLDGQRSEVPPILKDMKELAGSLLILISFLLVDFVIGWCISVPSRSLVIRCGVSDVN